MVGAGGGGARPGGAGVGGSVGGLPASLFQFVAHAVFVAALQAQIFTLALSNVDHVFEAHRPLLRRRSAEYAALLPLHTQLVPALWRDWQIRKLVIDLCRHDGS